MEKSTVKPKKYTKYLTLQNTYNGTLRLSDESQKASKTLFLIMFRQTNLKSKDSIDEFKNEDIEDAFINFKNSYFSNSQQFEARFGFQLFGNYLQSVKDKISSSAYKPILSNQKQVDYLLNGLTEVFFVDELASNGVGHIWMVFLENIKAHIDKLFRGQKDTDFWTKTHLSSVWKRAIPNGWGWFEFHIKCFVENFIKTLIECLNLKFEHIIWLKELDNIYEFSKKVLSRMKSMENGEIKSSGFSTLGDYINHNIGQLSEAIDFYENNRVENDDEVYMEEKNSVLGNFVKTPYDEKLYDIFKNLDFDFIDYFKGKSRRERVTNFDIIKNLLVEEKIIVHNDAYEYGIFWLCNDQKHRGKKITAFIQTLIEMSWIHEPDDKPDEILNKFKECFGLRSLKGVTTRNFQPKILNELMRDYAYLFKFIPQYQAKQH